MKRELQLSAALYAVLCLVPVATAGAEGRGATSPQQLSAGSAGSAGATDESWEMDEVAAKIVDAARAQIGNPYDASYVRIPYPNGDVPNKRGLCADVVVRALRGAGHDLQFLIHEDRKRNFQQYPRTWGWGRRAPDSNSDHRVVPNQMFFLGRFGLTLPREVSPATLGQWQPGDIVYWNSGSPLRHAGIVSDAVNDDGLPLVIHTMDDQVVEDNSLLAWPIIGHFRFPLKRQLNDQNEEASR